MLLYLIIALLLYLVFVLPCMVAGHFDLTALLVPILPIVAWPIVLLLTLISLFVFFLLVMPELLSHRRHGDIL